MRRQTGGGSIVASILLRAIYARSISTFFNSTLIAEDAVPVPTPGDDTLTGSSGDDIVELLAGDDIYHGGAGNDTVSGAKGQDEIYGDEGDDTLNGGKNNDMLFGGDDNDTLDGGFGDDYLEGGDGDDWITGNIVVETAPTGTDDWASYLEAFDDSLGDAWLSGGLGGVSGVG